MDNTSASVWISGYGGWGEGVLKEVEEWNREREFDIPSCSSYDQFGKGF